ncbi:triose-phosphate isomerase [Peptoniphilus mikwangii]|uniref:triose-phosphate isomerase n=1 Tax=Peptoniphilus mikwangii TaxID=1354300 RepID=UPI0004096995|nr:triose-phosphate isomerase [Peptoniphilus mikwangii]
MRKTFIAGNWKMNLNRTDTVKMLEELVKIKLDDDIDALICPPFTSICAASDVLKNSKIKLGAQTVSEYDDGAYTGEVSTNMLKDLDVSHVILGHSERRSYFGETNKIVNAKIKRALSEGLDVILCVGENQAQREENIHEEVVREQVEKSLEGISEHIEKITIAYEPVWAIGTGNTCKSEDAQSMCKFIRDTFKNMFSEKLSEEVRILYGGSVKPANIKELMLNEDIDGALVGGASLKSEDFSKLVNYNA